MIMSNATHMNFIYKNHKGEVGERRVLPSLFYFGSTQWHPVSQWLLRGFDLDRNQMREFAFKDIVMDLSEAKPFAYVCDGCGTFTLDPTLQMEGYKQSGHIACCPERRMYPLYRGRPEQFSPIRHEVA